MNKKTDAHSNGSPGIRAVRDRSAKEQRLTELVHTASQGRVAVTRGTDISHEFPLHVHHTYTIGIVESGSRVIRQQGTETVVHGGAGFVIEPGQPHSCATLHTSGHTYTIISANKDLMESLASEISGRTGRVPRFREMVFHDRELFERIRQLWNDQREDRSADRFPDCLIPILRTLISHHGRTFFLERPPAAEYSSVWEVRRYLEENSHRNLSQWEIAEVAGLSEFHFSRTFRRIIGVPPHAYHLRIRIRRAQELLSQGASIVSAALETGFVDQSHFTHCFKKTVGVSPGRYRLHKKP